MVDPTLQPVTDFLSGTFGIPADWFAGPQVIPFFIIPMITLVIFWYVFLNDKLRVFKNSFINFVLALAISLMSSSMLAALTPVYVVAASVGGIFLVMGNITFFRIILTAIIVFAVIFSYPLLMSFFNV
jgi:hypothetical protein